MKMKKLFLMILVGLSLVALSLQATFLGDADPQQQQDNKIKATVQKAVDRAYTYCMLQIKQAAKNISSKLSSKAKRIKLRALFDMKKMQTYLGKIKIDRMGYVFVMSSKGVLLVPRINAAPNLSLMSAKDRRGVFFVREICAKKNGSLIYHWRNADGREYRVLVVFRYIPALDWIVAGRCYL